MHSENNKRQIAFLCHPYHRGGVTRWMADAAIACAKKGYDTYFLTLEPKQTFFSGKGRETLLQLLSKEDAGINIIKKDVGRAFEFGTPEYRAFIYKRLFNHLPPGVPVILSDDNAVWIAATSLHDSFPIIGVLHSDESHYYDLGKKYANQLSVMVCVSKRVNKKIAEQLKGHDLPPVYTIPCGINLQPVNKAPKTQDALQLLYLGRITNYQKRVADLVKIAALLVKNNIPFHLNIVGDGGDDKIELQQKFKDEGLNEHVTFRGWLSQQEVAVCLNSTDILVLTSDFEGTPIAMMEALAAGCGVVGTRVSGIEDYEDDPGAEKCFMVYDAGALTDALSNIKILAAVPTDMRRKAAREIAMHNFSIEVCLQKYAAAIAAIPPKEYIPPVISLGPGKRIYSRMVAYARYLKVLGSGR